MRISRYFLGLLVLLTMATPVWARVDKKLTDNSLVNIFRGYSVTADKIVYESGDFDLSGIWTPTEIWTMNTDGSNKSKIVTSSAFKELAVSPDGTKIAYIIEENDTSELWIVNIDGSGQKKIDSVASTSWADLIWFPQSTKIVYTFHESGTRHMWVINSDGTGKVQLVGGLDYGVSPYWSPDGTKICFGGTINGVNGLYVMNIDGANKIKIANKGESPTWSSNNKIAYEVWESGKCNIWVVNPDGTGNSQLTTDEGINPLWSPDGAKITYDKMDSKQLWIMNAYGNNKIYLSDIIYCVENKSWRNDSQKIAFVSGTEFSYQSISIINPDGTGLETISSGGWLTFNPEFSLDGKKLFYTSGSDVWMTDFEATQVGYYIKGYVKDTTGTGISDITITLSDDASNIYTTTTSGYYEFTNLGSGNYTITPTKTNYSFTLTSKSYNPLNSNQENQNFIGTYFTTTNYYYIKGYIKDSNGTGINGVTVTLSGDGSGTYLTDSAGYFEFLNLTAGNYTITPTKTGWTFTPASRTYSSISVSVENQDFIGTQASEIFKNELKPINNVFNPNKNEKVTIQYSLTNSGSVSIKLYTSDGVLVKTLVDEDKSAGTYSVDWNGRNDNGEIVASGIYFVHIEASGFKETKKICVVK